MKKEQVNALGHRCSKKIDSAENQCPSIVDETPSVVMMEISKPLQLQTQQMQRYKTL